MTQLEPDRHAETARADARLGIFLGRRGWQAGTLVPVLVLAFCAVWIFASWVEITNQGKPAFNVDFRVFWAAARLAVSGAPLDALDGDHLLSVHQVTGNDWMPWIYPAGFLFAVMPLGLMSFSTAWVVFTAISVLAILAAIRPFSGGNLPVWLGFSLAPAMMPNMIIGQTSLLWTAGLVGALALIRTDKQILAGIIIGLLTLKPQLGLLIPIALIASGAWPTILSAAVTAIAISVLTTMWVGMEYWSELRALLHVQFELTRAVSAENALMISPYAMLAGINIPDGLALKLQWLVTGLAAVAVFVAWRSPKIGFDLKSAALLLGITIATPYLWYYEATLLAPAALFLLRAGVLSESPAGIILAGFMWLGLAPAFLVTFFSDIQYFGMRYAFTPVALAAMVVCLTAILRQLQDPLPASTLSQDSE